MGALILSPIGEAAQIGVTPRVQVVDGQQRLTTFQLFLAALREVALKHKCEDVAEHVRDYLFNKLKSKDTDKLTRFKLTPTPSDQEIFHDIIEQKYSTIRSRYGKNYWGGRVPKNTQFRALRAYEEFYRLINHFAQFGSAELTEDDEVDGETPTIGDETDTSEAVQARLEAMLTALLNRMKLVVITLGEDDDDQTAQTTAHWNIRLENQTFTASTGADDLEETLKRMTSGKPDRLNAVSGVKGRVRLLVSTQK